MKLNSFLYWLQRNSEKPEKQLSLNLANLDTKRKDYATYRNVRQKVDREWCWRFLTRVCLEFQIQTMLIVDIKNILNQGFPTRVACTLKGCKKCINDRKCIYLLLSSTCMCCVCVCALCRIRSAKSEQNIFRGV